MRELVWVSLEDIQTSQVSDRLETYDKDLLSELATSLESLQDDYKNYLEELEQCIQNDKDPKEVSMYKAPLPKYAVLHTDPREHWRYHYSGMYIPALIDNNETWKVYHCFDGEYPTEDELKSLKGVIIPGNEDDPIDDFEYLIKTKQLIKLIREEYPDCKIFGSCAGHQMIAASLGGECSRLEISSPMVFGKFHTKVTPEMKAMPAFEHAFGKGYDSDNISVLRSHGWIVSKLPEEAEGLGESQYGDYDFFKIDNQILATQCHPEFTEKFEEHHEIIPMHKEKYLTDEDKEEQMNNIYNEEITANGNEVLELVRHFFKNRESSTE